MYPLHLLVFYLFFVFVFSARRLSDSGQGEAALALLLKASSQFPTEPRVFTALGLVLSSFQVTSISLVGMLLCWPAHSRRSVYLLRTLPGLFGSLLFCFTA